MQLQAREKNLLGVLLIILLGMAVWNFLFASMWSRYVQATETVNSISAKLTVARESLAGRIALQRDEGVLQAALSKVVDKEDGDTGAQAVRRLLALARGLNLRLVEIKPSTLRKSGAFTTVPITARGDGDYSSVVQLMQRLYTTLPSYEVTRVQINAGSEQPDRVDFSMSVVARYYITPAGGAK